jgi:hypothetical protein
MKKIFTIFAATLFALWSACSSSEFSSSSGTKKGKQNVKEPGTDVDQGDDTTGSGNPDSTENPNSTDSGSLNPDGTITERFTGSLVKLEGGSDIIFAVDTSGSMRDEKTRLQQNMSAFLNKFSQDNAKLDYQVFLIGENFQFPQNLGEKFIPVPEKVGSTDALEILQGFFSGQIPQPKPVRESTKKQIIVVTDDNAKGVTYESFKNFVNDTPSLKGRTSFNGFVILQNSALNSWCTKAQIGSDYVSLANDADTKGTIFDLCTPDWGVLLKGLAEKILQDIPKERFPLNSTPVDPDDIKVTVDGKEVSQPDWSYDQDANAVVFTKDAAPADGAKVEATFKPE